MAGASPPPATAASPAAPRACPPPGAAPARVEQPDSDKPTRSRKRQNPPGVSRRIILNAVQDLAESRRTITRVAVASMTGFPFTVVDEHLDKLLEAGVVSRTIAGVFDYEPDRQPDRAVSVTLLPDVGRKVKIEIGDTVVDLTVREARMLGELTAGLMLRFGAKY